MGHLQLFPSENGWVISWCSIVRAGGSSSVEGGSDIDSCFQVRGWMVYRQWFPRLGGCVTTVVSE